MVFYRKYRPQTIEELDSKEVRGKLRSVLESSEVSHAFLFTGPKGLGKTSTARIVAKSLNCERLEDSTSHVAGRKGKSSAISHNPQTVNQIEPCNKCEQCVSITNGTNMDILEIDGASNRGIDEIRDLREKIKLSPMSAFKKVYIIDEVHMLTTEAFNALLKTLEEPPGHVIFILCTTEPHKVPPTIISRCLQIQFKKATKEELIRSFERIIKKEKLTGEREALELIADLSDGSFRDGVKILEEMALTARLADSGRARDKRITKELIEENYSIANVQYQTAQMIKFLEEKDTKRALEAVNKLVNEGIEMEHFMQGLIKTLHDSLLLKAGVEAAEVDSVLMIDNLRLSIEEIKRLIELLSEAKNELKYAVLPQLPLELAVIEWAAQRSQTGLSQDVQSIQRPVNSNNQTIRQSDRHITKITAPAAHLPKIPLNATQQDIVKYSKNDALWTALIDKVKKYNHSVAGVLRGCTIKSYDDKILLLQTNFKFHKDKLSETRTREILEKAGKEVTKKNVKIEVELKTRLH